MSVAAVSSSQGYCCASSVERNAPYHHALILFQVPAHVRGEIPETLQPIDIPRVEAWPPRDAARELTVIDVGGLERVVLEICVQAAVIRVAPGLADVLAQSARHWHRGRLAHGGYGNLRKRREVGEVVVVHAVGPADTNAFNLITVHSGRRPQSVGGVLLQAKRAVASHVHFRKRHARRVRHDREEVARAWQARELVAVKMGRDDCRRDVDHRRRATDGDAIVNGTRAQLDADGCRETEPDVDALADNRPEAGKLKRERVVAQGHCRKAVGARIVGDAGAGGHQRRPRQRDGHVGHDGLRAVCDDSIDGTRRRGHGLRFGGRAPVPCDDAQNQSDDPIARRRMTHINCHSALHEVAGFQLA